MDPGDLNGTGPLSSQRHDNVSNISRAVKSGPKQSADAQQSPFVQACTYLKKFYKWRSNATDVICSHGDFEEPFVCKLSTLEWWKLCSEFNLDHERYDRWPKFSYDSATSTLTIYAMASPVHESVIEFLRNHLILVVQAINEPLRSNIRIHTNRKINGFAEEYEDSETTPDLAVSVRDTDGEEEIKLVLQVGFSETDEKLQQDIRLWLNGSPTSPLTVLINITESPKYKCPLNFDLENCDILNIPQKQKEIRAKGFSYKGEYGPVEYKGHQWAGRISEVSMEIWTHNPMTEEPERKGSRMYIIPPTDTSPQFRLGDFLDVSPTDSQMASLNWDILRNELKHAIKSLAVFRCRDWLRQSRKRAGLVGDKLTNVLECPSPECRQLLLRIGDTQIVNWKTEKVVNG